MSIFQSSVLKKYLAAQNKEAITAGYKLFSSYFLDPAIQRNIRSSKEEQFQEGFLRELFVNILGYTLNPMPDFNLTTELKNVKDAKKTDGAILKDDTTLAVIELKGTDTKDLDKVTDQAFNYKNNHPDCMYVITSNFEKLRFYIHNAVEHEEFSLFALSYERFELLWLFLHKDNLLAGIPQKIKEESLVAEENVTKKLYKDYSAFKSDLWNDLVSNNPDHEELELYKKSQKLLDRFLFIFFAEDKGLLPPNSINQIVTQWEKLRELDEYRPLYERFRKYFGYLNSGHKGKNYEIHAYNGGLFKEDPILDAVTISDDVLQKHVLRLTEYDFDTEVDTNILGHIFEHSLNDIENVRAQLAGEEVDKKSTKRKKDGVFYTPKYITKYIVENTVGKLCEEKKSELGMVDEEFGMERKGRGKKVDEERKVLDQKLKTYREWLLQLTICDPACGSGAFLNQALEFLMDEHRYVDELESQLLGTALVFQEVENHILENNIFGVDINEESVDIARLSLWLRTAKKGRKLSSLSSNIKAGNSLIDDPEVAGALAFNWKEEFPQVFEKGGFDVVIGNPPYVSMSEFPKEIHSFFKAKYPSMHTGYNDLMYYFLYVGLEMLNVQGVFGVITSNYFIGNEYAKGIRKYLSMHLNHLINFEKYHVFQDANVHTAILLAGKATSGSKVIFETYLKNIELGEIVTPSPNFKRAILNRNDLGENWIVADSSKLNLLKKLQSENIALGEISEIAKGSESGKNEVFTVDKRIIKEFEIENNILRKCIKNSNIESYLVNFDDQYLIYADNEFNESNAPNAFKYLEKHKNTLLLRRGPKTGEYSWWRLHRPSIKDVFDYKEKILVPYRADKNRFAYDDQQLFNNGGDVRAIKIVDDNYSTKYVVAILNSTLMNWYYGFIGKPKGKSREYFNKPLSIIPIALGNIDRQMNASKLVDDVIYYKKALIELNSAFLLLLGTEFSIDKISKKLQNWETLDFKGFVAELSKNTITLTLDEKNQWLQYFTKKKQEANTLQQEITRLDNEIDQMVYKLYGLTEDEIKIVEESVG